MTDDRLPLPELAAKRGDSDFLRAIAESVLNLTTIEEETTLQITPKAA
ncbi:hypothetical protein [Rhizobium rhododendri]|uniref:Transposase n=1 Tax=Rhizobium rhododendri TaxID=2506430 RepID=A0ABY8IQX6_9HYPH|nr:hypothetical protein [Rhizobium rhododendri]WFS26113.1 hypothetical protein PR018_23325 [Rhizobium rhododendri]